jgi:hypothetical protein
MGTLLITPFSIEFRLCAEAVGSPCAEESALV